MLSAAIGVVFGAWVASRAQTKRTIVAELHALRAAHALCFSIANKALSIKKQHIRPLKFAFDQALAAHGNYVANPHGVFGLQIDLKTISQIEFPAPALERTLLDRCFLGGEGIATLVAVMDAVHDLKASIALRNQMVEEFRKNPPPSHEQRLARYFGLPAGDQRDERFKDNVGALYAQTDDCIFFARKLGEHIRSSENKVRKRNHWKYWLPGKSLKPAKWTLAEQDGLLPLDSDYANWTRGFAKDPSFFDRIKNFLRRAWPAG